MRRLLYAVLFVWLLTACDLLPAGNEQATATLPAGTAVAEAVPSSTLTVAPPPTDTAAPPTPTPTATPSPVPTATQLPLDLAVAPDDIFIYPVPRLYTGDRATVQIIATVPENITPGDVEVHLLVNEQQIAAGTLNGRNLGGDAVGLFTWVWDTTGVVGEQYVTVLLDPNDVLIVGDENPDNNRADLLVDVRPAEELPPTEAGAQWITAETEYTILHVVSGTAAARDLEMLKQVADTAVAQAAERLQEQPQRKFDVYLINRVLGQGGYASSAMVISYLDRNYAGGGLYEVLVHETVHLLDQQFAHHRLPFLSEGLAVWATGGHYKPENLDQRMAALRAAGMYVPLAQLIDDFYPVQHEVGYLEGAGFMKFLVDSYGWPAVRAFYADVAPEEGQLPSQVVDQTLQRHFSRSLADLEAEWTAYLDRLPYPPEVTRDLLLTIRYYDVMRLYQLQYDPTAHFLQAWLPFPQDLENRQLTAEVTRHPDTEMHVALETMLQTVDTSLRAGNYTRASALLDSVERVLRSDGQFLDPIATHHLNIVSKLSALGYRVQSIEVSGDQALVLAHTAENLNLAQLILVLRNQDWILTN